jgi:outer membrane receptor protein involved in Fe transport
MTTRNAWLAASLLLGPGSAFAQAPRPAPTPTPLARSEYVEVTATRIPEETVDVPASITVLTARDLREIGAGDLSTALRFAAGVDMVPGGDAGPAAAVPEIWGLRELDSVLLVVDGVPRSGAFVPDFESIDLADVERYELRLDGRNLTDQRPPVAESEVGDTQYYRLPSREVRVSARVRF